MKSARRTFMGLSPLVAMATMAGGLLAMTGQAGADVTTVTGSAYGYSAQISLFGGMQPPDGPAPTVTLPPAGSAEPVTASAATGLVKHGPANFFSSGPINVSTQGTKGPGGAR